MEEENLIRLAELLNILGVENRLRIVKLLMEYDSVCVNGLARRLEISQSAVSQHLRILHLMEFVTSERRGYYTHYSINSQRFREMMELLREFSGGIDSDEKAECRPEGGGTCAEEEEDAADRTS